MPPTLIPAPSFTPAQQDQDFEDDFDLPEGDTVIPSAALPPITIEDDDGEEDWDREFAPPPSAAAPRSSAASSSKTGRGTITNLGAAKLGGPRRGGQPLPEEWDDDEDFDLPPPSSKPLKLSLSPRTKIRMDNEAGRGSLGGGPKSNRPSTVSTVDDEDDEDAWNASTIKVSKLALDAAISQSVNPPAGGSKTSTSSVQPTNMDDDDFEDDLVIPDNVATLALKPVNLAHRVSKISLDGWGDNTSSTVFSDASSGTPQPSPSVTASQPSTEDESDDFGDEEGEFDGLELPDSLSSKEMQKMLEDKKKGLNFESKDAVRVARPSDGEDDFEMGLVIGNDEDLSPSRLKSQILPPRAVGRGTIRSISEPQPQRSVSSSSTASITLTQSDRIARPPSRLREEITNSGSDRESTTSPTLVIPPRHPTARATTESFPSLRRTPSSIIPSRQPATRYQTLSTSIRPSPSLLLPKASSSSHQRPPSPPKISSPLPNSPSPSPYPKSPSPVSSTASTTRYMSGSGPLSPGGPSSSKSGLKAQKSFSKIPSSAAPTASSNSKQKLPRKTSMSAIIDTRVPSRGSLPSATSPSPPPEVPFPSSSRPGLRRVGGGLTHAASYRDLSGGTATVGPSSSTPLERKKYSYEAPTVAYSAKRAQNLGRKSAASDMSGSERERDRPSIISSASSSRVVSRSRPSITSVFPGALSATAGSSSVAATTSATTARSPSPRTAAPLKKASYSSLHQRSVTAPSPPQPPAVRVLRRPKKSRIFSDGSELDAIEDLAVERDKESKYRVIPSGRGNVGQGRPAKQPAPAPPTTVGPTGTIGRRRGLVEVGMRPSSSASSQGSMVDPPKPAPGLRRQGRTDFSKPETSTPPTRKTKDGKPVSAKKKPTLIRNLGGTNSPKVVGDMKWNPKSLKWEGNDSILKEFENSSSSRPALITHLTGSSMGGINSPPGTFSSLMSGARVVGEMMFDPIRMCWISTNGEEEDPFAAMDEMGDDEDDWDADGKGGTIRALVTTSNGPGSTTASSARRDSGISSEEGSPPRSRRGSHGRSASESDNESITGASATGGRSSSLGGPMLTINEHEDGSFPIPRDLIAACSAAEDRQRSEMRGWHATPATTARRRISIRNAPQIEPEEPDRSYLWDIRALATRNNA